MAKRALVSVSDISGLVDFVKGLQTAGWEIIATCGTQKLFFINETIRNFGLIYYNFGFRESRSLLRLLYRLLALCRRV